ncbi:unnamed protein product [Phytomonas sp. Hart1]|nr:unnamed protein product [Phytomonas sp. Hart1]|eukprot:CCW68247.1 unnamed protein product [Phytomonas sp. isolate Hart1]
MDKQVFFLCDSWATLAVVNSIRVLGRRKRDRVARYVVHGPAVQRVFRLCGGGPPVEITSAFFVGRAAEDGGAVVEVWVGLPSLGQVFFDGTMFFARIAQMELVRQYACYCRIAKLQTIGGGWASLREPRHAMQYAVELFHVASVVGNDVIMGNCRIFVGWALLWSGKTEKALQLFKSERKIACMRNDLEQQRRCENAIINAKTNTTLKGQVLSRIHHRMSQQEEFRGCSSSSTSGTSYQNTKAFIQLRA